MSMSGIELDDEAVKLYNDMKLKKVNKFAVFKLDGAKNKVVQVKVGEPRTTCSRDEDKEEFEKLKTYVTEENKEHDPCYIIYDARFKKRNGTICNKMVFIGWCEDTCPVKKRMLFGSTKDGVKKKFGDGISVSKEAHETGELDYDEIAEELEKK